LTVLALPTIGRKAPTQASFGLAANTQSFESPLNKSVQTNELPGARWSASWTYNNLTGKDARILKAWLAKLRGQAGRFACFDYTHWHPSGKAREGGTVHGAGQTGAEISLHWTILTLTIDNSLLTADMTDLGCSAVHETYTDWLLPGDYIGINGELKMVTDFVAMSTGGTVAVAFEPPLRSIPADGAIVTVIRPTCTMKLVDDMQDAMTFREAHITDVTIKAVEVF
jgi:hypothetical protein